MALSAAPASPQSHPLIDALEAQHQQSKAQFGKLDAAHSQMSLLRNGLDSLGKMGEAVTADDVIEEAGKLVAGGITPDGLIALMAGDPSKGQAPMPESGQALASWVQGHEAQFAQQEQQVKQAHAVAANKLGQDATKVLLAHHLADKMRAKVAAQSAAPQAPPSPSANPLSS